MTDFHPLRRYQKQILLKELGEEAQRKLLASTVVIIGCGGLGSAVANSLVRAGIGKLIIADRDVVEEDNLPRQILYDEEDVKRRWPKAVAAAEKMRKVNSRMVVTPLVVDIDPGNIEEIIRGAHLVLDGTDNFETRFLINDACVKLGIPWIYGGVVATGGMCFAIIPDETPCLRCLMNALPPPGSTPTGDTMGILGTAVQVVAALEATEGLKILAGKKEALLRKLIHIDLWSGRWRLLEMTKEKNCPACGQGIFEFLHA